jgi:signal transduction histidine kinase
VNIAPGEYFVHGDLEQLQHTIKNIIDNSIKYTPEGNIDIALSQQSGKILFSVKDSGVGISPEDRPRLFTEGGNGKNSRKVNVDSTGYGLYIAKKIVDTHGGRIWAESLGEGKGSTFFVELPVASS